MIGEIDSSGRINVSRRWKDFLCAYKDASNASQSKKL